MGRIVPDKNEYDGLVKKLYQACFEGVLPAVAAKADGVSSEYSQSCLFFFHLTVVADKFKEVIRRVTASMAHLEAVGAQGLGTQVFAVGGMRHAIGQMDGSYDDADENLPQTAGKAESGKKLKIPKRRAGSADLGTSSNPSGLGDVGAEHKTGVLRDVKCETSYAGVEDDIGDVGDVGYDTDNVAPTRRSASPQDASMKDEVISLTSSFDDIPMSASPVLNRFPEPRFSPRDMRCAENRRLDQLETTVVGGLEKLRELRRLLESSTAWRGETDWIDEIDKTVELAQPPKVVIGIVGATGAGKSSIINAIADEENILATNCMRASTAVATEVSYSNGPHRYKAQIEFINRNEWEEELEMLFADLFDNEDDVMRNCVPKDSEAAAALEKIRALYPGMEPEDVLRTSVEDLLNDDPVTQLLGTSVVIEEDDPKVFSKTMVSYLDSKGKRKLRDSLPVGELEQNHGLWPLIRVVRVYTKSEALSTGAILVDLPGVFDSNAARVAVAEESMKRCSAHWIVAPINRAADDKVARDLLTKNFKRQMQMDCAFNDITFVCTKTDDISVSEVQDSLQIELPPPGERVAREKKIKNLTSEVKELNKKKTSFSSKQSKIDDKIDKLDAEMEDADDQPSPQVTPQKRKSVSDGHVPETSNESPSLPGSHNAAMTTPQRGHKRELSLLKSQRKDFRTKIRSLDDQIRAKEQQLASLKAEAESTKKKILQDCIEARNKYSKKEIKREFIRAIHNVDEQNDEAEILDDAPNIVTRDVKKMEEDLPVFCVSSKAYQQLCGRLRNDSRADGFGDVKNTEIPALQCHCIAVTEKAREATARRVLLRLAQLFQSMTIWASTSQPEVSLARKNEIRIGFNQCVGTFKSVRISPHNDPIQSLT